MKKVFVSFVLFGVVMNPISFVFAKTKVFEERGRDLALQFIDNSLGDEDWKDNNPTISREIFFYTDKDKVPSYIEYKISCSSTPDCGFIIVNVDGDDVAVPISSPSGNTPSEVSSQGSKNEKYYYFSPFDIYSEDTQSGEVQAFDPQKQVDLRDDSQQKRTPEEKQANKEAIENIKSELKAIKTSAKEFKKSDDFKKQKEEIKDQILNIPKEEFSMKMLNSTFADLPDANTLYVLPGVSNIFIPTSDNSTSTLCYGKTPCYDQFQQTYGSVSNCYSGCTPTAIGIIFGYYDRNGFPNLIPFSTAPLTNTTSSKSLINSIRTLVGTTCSGPLASPAGQYYSGNSNPANAKNAKTYAINMGYLNSQSSYITGSTSTIFSKVKTEINAGRPILIHVNNPNTNADGHALVGFGYKSTGTMYIARVNMGWGGSGYYTSGTTKFYKSNIDQNLSAIFYLGSNNKTANAVTTFTIAN